MSSNCLATTLNIAFSNSLKSHFGVVKSQKISSKGLATTWNFAFSTSTKSLFGMVKTQKISSQCLGTNWNIAFSNSHKSHFRLDKGKEMSSFCPATPWKFFYRTHQIRILGWSNRKKWFPNTWRTLETLLSRSNTNPFAGHGQSLKHRFHDLRQVALSYGLEA